MTDLEYLDSPFEQLRTRDKLLELQSVMARYDVRSAEELDSRLRGAESRMKAMRNMFDDRKRQLIAYLMRSER